MSFSLEACKAYAEGDITEALTQYNVVKHKSNLNSRVTDICLQMGGGCKDDKAKYQRLAQELTKQINIITEDEKEKDNLYNFANRVIKIGRNYLFLNQGY